VQGVGKTEEINSPLGFLEDRQLLLRESHAGIYSGGSSAGLESLSRPLVIGNVE
jgi:hypothetical protein